MAVLSDAQVNKILSIKLKHEDFVLEDFTLKPLQAEMGIMGQHLQLKCTIFDQKLGRSCTNVFFVKKTVLHNGLGDMGKQVFKKEIKVFEAFHAMNFACINTAIPECFYVDDDHLVLSDLTDEKFSLLRSQGYASDLEIRVILKSLAGIHAGGIIYEEKQRESTGDLKFSLPDAFPGAFMEVHLQPIPITLRYFSAIIQGITNAVKFFEMPQTLSNGERFIDEVQTLWRIFETSPSKKFRNTICHNDLWHANLFVKRGDDLQAKIIDFQIVRYLPPAADVLLVLLTNTSRDYRREHLDELLLEYFTYFTDYLRKENINPDDIYSFEAFIESTHEMKFYAMMCYSFITPLVACDKQKMDAMIKSEEMEQILFHDRSLLLTKFKDDEYYMMRVKEVMLELQDFFEGK